MLLRIFIASALFTALTSTLPAAVVLFNETDDGDASNDFNAPQDLGILGIDDYQISGAMDNFTFFPNDVDAFTFNIPVGIQIDAIVIDQMDGDDHFFGLDDAATIEQNASALVVATLVSNSDEGLNVLDPNQVPPDFSNGTILPPLGPGDYAIQVQETQTDVFLEYAFTIQTSAAAVPEPSSLIPTMAILAGCMMMRRKRRVNRCS